MGLHAWLGYLSGAKRGIGEVWRQAAEWFTTVSLTACLQLLKSVNGSMSMLRLQRWLDVSL
jgi:hypothetical protein